MLARHQERWDLPADNSKLIIRPTDDQQRNIYEFVHDFPKHGTNFRHLTYELAQNYKFSKIQLVNSKDKLKEVISSFPGSHYLIIDTFSEYRSSYKGYISYLLLSINSTGYLIDAAQLHDELYQLKAILQFNGVVKFCMKALNVLNDFKRDFQIFPCNVMDLSCVERFIQLKSQGIEYKTDGLSNLINNQKCVLIQRPTNKVLLEAVQEKFELMGKYIMRLYEYFSQFDPQYRSYGESNFYTNLLLEFHHNIPSQIDEDHVLLYSIKMRNAQKGKFGKENKENTYELPQRNKYDQKLCQKLLEWRDHMARMHDISPQEQVPYIILVEIKNKAKSVLQISQIFSQFYSNAHLQVEKYENILGIIELHKDQVQNMQNQIEVKKPFKKEDKRIRMLLQELNWADAEEWLNRKNDQSIKLYKEIVSIDALEDSIVEDYINDMDQSGLKKTQISRFIKYADCFRNGNHKKLKNLYQIPYTQQETNLMVDDQKKEQFIEKGEESDDSEHLKSQTSLTSLDGINTEGIKAGVSSKSVNTMPTELDLKIQEEEKKKQKIKPLPQNIQEIYRKAVNVKKNYNKIQKKKTDKKDNKSKGKNIEETQDFVPTSEDLRIILDI